MEQLSQTNFVDQNPLLEQLKKCKNHKKTRKIFEESIPSLMRIGSGSASSLVTIRNRGGLTSSNRGGAPSSSTHFLFQQANRPLPTLSNNLTIKKDQGSKGGVYGLPMIEHGDQNCIGGNEDSEKESIGHSTSKVCSQDFACYNLVAVEERDRCHTMIQRLSGLLTGHREINEEAQKNQLLWIEVMEK
ncbi:hypothetical protein PPACK8108_LOCUS26165 [Phakopsora pachyrhizi]|uniref:Uncharacterized protein n=1 Tax=Phakopsora pachyrhizi TaxID=170000 RepID=A0AAV0BU48_PHAPC|nr:hypothetical protein PPACK8108_LOCUS26165 [Phakopsora pachyrhizi]